MNLLMTREDAKDMGLKFYLPHAPCSKGHFYFRQTSSDACMRCNLASVKKWRKKTGYKTDPEYMSSKKHIRTCSGLRPGYRRTI